MKCCPHCGDTDIELVPVADGVKFDVRPQLKDGTYTIRAGVMKITSVEDLIEIAEMNACRPYAYCHSCTAEFDYTGLDEDDYQGDEEE